jgi:dihydrodipicolinate synthase/N-acetylneuraminate lyase
MKIGGFVSATLLVPFDADGSVSFKGIVPTVNFVVCGGVDGLYSKRLTG